MKKILLCFITIFLLASFPSFGQTITEIESTIGSILETETADKYKIKVIEFSSLNDSNFSDPYNTLSNVYIFSGSSYSNNVIGFFKNGDIIWKNTTIIASSYPMELLYTKELNKDNQVELIFGLSAGFRSYGDHIWVISWNGSSGKILNEFDSNGYSKILAAGGIVLFPDYEADGIYEIMTIDLPSTTNIQEIIDQNINSDKYIFISKWNGLTYSVVDSVLESQLSLENLRKDALMISVKFNLSESDSLLTYEYLIYNDEGSDQKLYDVNFNTDFKSYKVKDVPEGWIVKNSAYGFINWTTNRKNFQLEPSDTLSSLILETKYPPRPLSVFAQGFNETLPVAYLNLSIEERKQDIENNSYSDITLGPWLPDSSMSLEAFTDTLETFRHRSCSELDWATNSTVCSQLEEKVNNVGNFLSVEDTVQAANTLQEFIDLVEAEKDASLTSEGYALLYYNAQYLAGRLREQ